jgi:hypothetical protein
MTYNNDLGVGVVKPAAKKSDKIEVVKILVLALVSFGLGFGLVILFLGPETGERRDLVGEVEEAQAPGQASAAPPSASGADAKGGFAPAGQEGYAPSPADAPSQEAEAEGAALADEATAPVEVPPGRTPENVALDGSAFYLKCWDDNNAEIPGTDCDRLEVLEKRFSTRLYVVEKCRIKHAGEKAEGKLSIGMEVDFGAKALSFWNGASSDLEKASEVAVCLRDELKGLPIHSVDHKHSKYRMFFTVVFGKSKKKAAQPTPSKPPLKAAKGATVDVVMDRVRVRKTPVDGEIIGKISSGNQVKLLKKKDGWCQVLTPNNNEGWMTCEALSK